MKQLKLAAYVNRNSEPLWVQFDLGRNYSTVKDMSGGSVIANFADGIALLADLKMLRSEAMSKLVNAKGGSIVFFLYEIGRCDSTKPIVNNVLAQRLYKF